MSFLARIASSARCPGMAMECQLAHSGGKDSLLIEIATCLLDCTDLVATANG